MTTPPAVWNPTSPATPGASITRRSTTASATTKRSTATPSLARLSPSSATRSRSGVCSRRSAAKTETGPVAARMAASIKASSDGTPAPRRSPKLTAAASTAPATPSKRIHGSSRRIAAARMEKPASNSSGGKKTASTRVGLTVNAGTTRAVASMAPRSSSKNGHGQRRKAVTGRAARGAPPGTARRPAGQAAAFRRRWRLPAPP